jgi:hypothetical protein
VGLPATRRHQIRFGATSLHYLPKSQFCRACFDGDYPIAVPEEYALCKMRFEKGAPADCEP